MVVVGMAVFDGGCGGFWWSGVKVECAPTAQQERAPATNRSALLLLKKSAPAAQQELAHAEYQECAPFQ